MAFPDLSASTALRDPRALRAPRDRSEKRARLVQLARRARSENPGSQAIQADQETRETRVLRAGMVLQAPKEIAARTDYQESAASQDHAASADG